MKNKEVTRLLALVLARPSEMDNMTDEEVISIASVAANSSVEKFFEEQICAASVSVEKSTLAQLALMNMKAG